MKQVISDLLAKATAFLQQLAAKNTASHNIDLEEIKRSVSSATLNLRSRASEALSGSVESKVEVAPVPQIEETVDSPVVDTEVSNVPEPSVETVAESVAEQVVVEAVKPAEKPEVAVVDTHIQQPEDSALRRHYLTQRQAEIFAELGGEPSDSTLKRHYQQLLAAKIAEI